MARTLQPEIIYLDTHILLWLHDGLVDRLSTVAVEAIETGRLFVSPMAELELQYLHEIGRFRPTAKQGIGALQEDIGLQRSRPGFHEVATRAHGLVWTRDPFDRLIVAETMVYSARLVTKDETILNHFAGAVW